MWRTLALLCMLLVGVDLGAAPGSGATKPAPTANEVQTAVKQYFARLPGYQAGDLIDRSQAAAMFADFQRRGWIVQQGEVLLQQVPSPDGFLARELRTPQGKAFMRRIVRIPQCYDRVDRLSQLIRGEQTVRDLIRGPDGYKMIEYLGTSQGGKQLGRMLSSAPNGTNFNQPTGRIYTAEALASKLRVTAK
jgi:hypothetical protein